MFNVETKSQLARLMANENIKVEHRSVRTASFHLETRTLVCPIWKDMSGHLYDLLLGHEVGHATETPTEGWHDAVVTDPRKNFKHFLNVVEDARIEKKIKRRYPGLRQSFVKAYNELIERDFFGIKKHDIQKSFLIDRINLHFKLGSNIFIEFTPEEQKFVDMVSKCETWNDVVDAAEAIYAYSKKEQNEQKQEQQQQNKKFEKEFSQDSDDEEYDDSDEEEFDDEESDDSDEEESDDMDQDEEYEDVADGSVESDENQNDEDAPDCITDKEFRKQEQNLLDEKSAPYRYITVPTPILSKIINKEANKELTKHFQSFDTVLLPDGKELLSEFKTTNERYISLLAKEFEMKKAADSFSKKRVSETGDIDVSKVYRYKVDDTIFRKIMHVPKGKSHGLVMLLDKSGSMQSNMSGAIEQILVLTMFCRKVNIPFVVYGFTNYINCLGNQFSKDDGDLQMRKVGLREMLSSKMKTSEFTEAVKNQLRIKKLYDTVQWAEGYLPNDERLSNTPLNEALVASKVIIEQFKIKNNLDMVNLVIVHDGDSDGNSYICGQGSFVTEAQTIFLKDKKSKVQIKLEQTHRAVTAGLMDYITQTTGAKVMGFFIAGRQRYLTKTLTNYYTEKNGKTFCSKKNYIGNYFGDTSLMKELIKNLRKEKYIESYTTGYDRMFIIPGGSDLKLEDEIINVEGKITASKLATAFMKVNKSRQTSRVMIGRFIEAIAKH